MIVVNDVTKLLLISLNAHTHTHTHIGNHRVLEVDVSQSIGVVKRVFGSASGISGPAADGTTIDKMLLNR